MVKPRKRKPIDDAAIESFASAADAPLASESPAAHQEVSNPARAKSAAGGDWPEGMSKQLLLRFSEPSIPTEIEALQQLIGRNKHQTTLLALRRGLEVLRAEVNALGDRADLIR